MLHLGRIQGPPKATWANPGPHKVHFGQAGHVCCSALPFPGRGRGSNSPQAHAAGTSNGSSSGEKQAQHREQGGRD
eukprot:794717-Lingulodinium_polyedra.AAC.1